MIEWHFLVITELTLFLSTHNQLQPGATLYNQDSAFPAHTSGSRPYSHGNSASTAAAAATPTTLAPGVDLYGEDFVQGAWIP
jgi:hypothetical protein